MATFKMTTLAAAVAASVSLPVLASSDFSIEEIVVTAQKRAQNTQDIGLAIAAVSGQSLRDQGIDQAADLAKIIPNVSMQNVGGGGVPVVIIRGVGLQNFRINDTPTTAFYVDEVYQTSVASAEFSMYDLERVEMLKGPQGGLYGRNTIAGAIQIISNTPEVDESMNGYLKAGYGSYDKKEFEGGITVPLSDIAAARFSGRWVKSDDTFYDNVTTGEDHGEEDRWGGRSVIRIQPNDTMDFVWKLHAGEDTSDLPLLRAVGNGCPAPGTDPANCGTISGFGPTPDALGLRRGSSGLHDGASGGENFLDNSWWGTSLRTTFDIGEYTLTSISAYDEIDYRRMTDIDAISLEYQEIDYRSEIEAWSQEFRLAFEGDNYSWVAGINYSEDELVEDTVLKSQLLVGVYGADTAMQPYTQTAEAWAIYGHGEWQFADQWNLVGELRHTDEERSFEGGTFGGTLAISADDKENFDAFSGKLALERMIGDNMMAYASYSRGFKTGGFFGGLATNEVQLSAYDSETNDAYEFGLKSDWLDGTLRVNGSVFYYDRQDVQASAKDASGLITVSRLTNIGDVETKGAEMDVTWLPTQGLTLNLGLGYTDAEIVDSDKIQSDITGTPGFSLEGKNVPNYSKWSANFIGKYEQPVGNNLLASVQFEYSYRSERDLSQIVNPAVEDVMFEESGYDLMNLRIGIGSDDDIWKVTAFVENLADEEYRTLGRGDGLFGVHELYGAPRTWGLNFTRNWD